MVAQHHLSGSIAPEMGSLTHMQRIVLSNNCLERGIPTEIGLLSQLQWLLLNRNELDQSIPSELGLLSDNYQKDVFV